MTAPPPQPLTTTERSAAVERVTLVFVGRDDTCRPFWVGDDSDDLGEHLWTADPSKCRPIDPTEARELADEGQLGADVVIVSYPLAAGVVAWARSLHGLRGAS